VRDFQREYILASDPSAERSGEPGDVDATLRLFHDDGALPSLGSKVPEEEVGGFAPGGQLAKRIARTDEDPHPPLGAGKSQPSPSGAAAATTRPALRVRIRRAFALEKGTLHAPAKAAPEALADPDAILDEYYPSAAQRTYRFPKLATHVVIKANLHVFFDGTFQRVEQTDAAGLATISLVGAPASSTLRIVVIPPDENDLITPAPATKPAVRRLQLNRTNAPAGPDMTTAATSEEFLYRVFVFEVDLDGDGLVALVKGGEVDVSRMRVISAVAPAPDDKGDIDPAAVTDAAAPASPPYVKRIGASVLKDSSGTTPEVEIDWRCDWLRGPTVPRYEPHDRFAVRRTVLTAGRMPAPPEKLEKDAPRPSIVIHQTHSVAIYSGVIHSFLVGNRDTSIHYVVDLDGHAVKMTDESFVTFHAGDSQWANRNAVNFHSIGIETIHSDATPPGEDTFEYTPREFPQEQYDGLIRLCRELMTAFGIDRRHVFGHRDCSVTGPRVSVRNVPIPYPGTRYVARSHGGKPDCPGMFLQWEVLEDAGVASAPSASPTPPFVGDEDDEESAMVLDVYMSPPETLNRRDKHEVTSVTPKGYSAARLVDVFAVLRRCLFDLGYSLSAHDPSPTRNDLGRNAKTHELEAKLDGALLQAISTFQTHHFSGARRAYRHDSRSAQHPRKPTLGQAPRVGHIDAATIRAVIECWWGWRSTG